MLVIECVLDSFLLNEFLLFQSPVNQFHEYDHDHVIKERVWSSHPVSAMHCQGNLPFQSIDADDITLAFFSSASLHTNTLSFGSSDGVNKVYCFLF